MKTKLGILIRFIVWVCALSGSLYAAEYNNTSFYVAYDSEDPRQYALVMPSVNRVYTHKAGEIQPSDLTQVDGELASFPTYTNGELCFPALKAGASGLGGASKMAGNCYDVHYFYVQKEVITEGAAFMLYYDVKDKVQEGLAGKSETFQTVKEGDTITNANSMTGEEYTNFCFDVGTATVKFDAEGGCSGGGSRGDTGVTPPVQKIISGYVLDETIIGATVKLLSLENDELERANTDSNGSYSLEVSQDKIANGFMLEATGGTMNGADFNDTLLAIYNADENISRANVTLITTLVAKMAMEENAVARSGTILDNRDDVLQKLSDMGMIQLDDWFTAKPSLVNLEQLQDNISEKGLNDWSSGLSEDSVDSQLSLEFMIGFPKANGGILSANIGTNNVITAYENKTVSKGFNLFLYDTNSTDMYNYSIQNSSDGMSITNEGVLNYTSPAELSANTSIDIKVKITNQNTLKSRIVPVSINILDAEVLASGTLGTAGGIITNDWEDVVLTVPERAVDRESEFKVLKSIDEDGSIIYRTTSSQPLNKLLSLSIPPEVSSESMIENKSLNKIQSRKREIVGGWNSWDSWEARYIETRPGDYDWFSAKSGVKASNRIRNDVLRTELTIGNDIPIKSSVISSSLFSLCPYAYETSVCVEREPVLFVHGFSTGPDGMSSDGIGTEAGGGEGTWGKFPELLQARGYAVFEFTWKTNSTFKDAADDLANAIRLIQYKTGKKVHIIAHSFGGLLSRTYIQGKARSFSYKDNVQSLLTLSTPHSGIFNSSVVREGINFYSGQDASVFAMCMQSSCYQAGYMINNIQITEGEFDVSDILGLSSNGVGALPVELATDFRDNNFQFPVPVRVLKALTVDRKVFTSTSRLWDEYQNGDVLISYAGQSFYPENSDFYRAISENVEESVLGAPAGVLPGDNLEQNETYIDGERINFEGYRHSQGKVWVLNGLGQGGAITTRGDVGIAYVENNEPLADTGKPHEALTEALAWLHANTIEEETIPQNITLEITVVDAETEEVLPDSIVLMRMHNSTIARGTTNSEGVLSLEVPFEANTKYGAFVAHNGYHTDSFNEYQTGATLESSSTTYPKIELQPSVAGKGTLVGEIIDSVTGNKILDVSVAITSDRNAIVRNTITDANGQYSVADLPRGDYHAKVVKEGYLDSTFTFSVQPNQINNGDRSLIKNQPEDTVSKVIYWTENKVSNYVDGNTYRYDYSMALYDDTNCKIVSANLDLKQQNIDKEMKYDDDRLSNTIFTPDRNPIEVISDCTWEKDDAVLTLRRENGDFLREIMLDNGGLKIGDIVDDECTEVDGCRVTNIVNVENITADTMGGHTLVVLSQTGPFYNSEAEFQNWNFDVDGTVNMYIEGNDSVQFEGLWETSFDDIRITDKEGNPDDYFGKYRFDADLKTLDSIHIANSNSYLFNIKTYTGKGVASSQLKKTGQTKSYDEAGSVVTDGSIKDDGNYQTGVTPSYTRDDAKR